MSYVLEGLVVAVVTPILTGLAFLALRRVCGLHPAALAKLPVTLEELQKRYVLWDLAFLPLVFGCWLGMGTLYFFGARWWQGTVLAALPPAAFALQPPVHLFLLLATLFGIVASALPLEFVQRRLLGGQRWAEYQLYQHLRYRMNVRRAFVLVATPVMAATLLVLPFAVRANVRFTDTALIQRPWFSFGGQELPYSGLKEIRWIGSFKAPSGRIVQRPYYELEFTTGQIWSTRKSLCEFMHPADADAAMRFVSERSGRPIQRSDPFP